MLGVRSERATISGKFAQEIRECVRKAYLHEMASRSVPVASASTNVGSKIGTNMGTKYGTK
jgi:hypothetical protein